ncbi:MAG: hypothetical protein ACRCZO_17600 [Cetobacterium sp.]
MKVACTVWSRGKGGDNLKALPIAIYLKNYTNKRLLIAEKYNYKFTLEDLKIALKNFYSNPSSYDTAFHRIKKYVKERHMEFYGCYIDSDKEFIKMAKSLVEYYDFD